MIEVALNVDFLEMPFISRQKSVTLYRILISKNNI
jgi:hypothetical protein